MSETSIPQLAMVSMLALASACAAFYFTVRLRTTYFLGSRFFIALANLGFIVILLENTYTDLTAQPPSPLLYLFMVSVMVTSVGFASYLVQKNSGLSGLKDLRVFLSRPPRQFVAFILIVLVWTSGLALNPVTQSPPIPTVQGTIFQERYEAWFLATSLILLSSFLALPVLGLYRTASHVSDPKASSSVRMISLAWASFGLVAFASAVLTGPNWELVQPVGQVVNGLLFMTMAFALREPTVLSRIIVGRAEMDMGLFDRKYDNIVLYDLESDRRRLLEEFLRGSTSRSMASPAAADEAVCYVAKAEVPIYRALSHPSGQRRTMPIIVPIEEALSGNETGRSTLGGRELIDLSDLDVKLCREFIHSRRKIGSKGVHGTRTWAINVESDRQQRARLIQEIQSVEPDSRLVDLAGNRDSFSQRLGMVHDQLEGSRILLEYDPTLDYERTIAEFASEFLTNVEPVAVFTSIGSPIEREIEDKENVRAFVFSSKISTPSRVSETRVLLPERDTSLLIDAVDKLVQSHRQHHVALVIDAITDLILSQGFEKSYGVLSSIVEIAEANGCTALVLVNYTCLEEHVIQGLRGLFRHQARHDPEGLKLIRSSNVAGNIPENQETTSTTTGTDMDDSLGQSEVGT